MEKLSLTVQIPALEGTYNFIVPGNMLIRDAQKLMVKILSSEYGISEYDEDVMLLDMAYHAVLKEDESFENLGITNGTKLLMS